MSVLKPFKVVCVPDKAGKYSCCCFADCKKLNNGETPAHMVQCDGEKCINWIHSRCNNISKKDPVEKMHILCMSCTRVENRHAQTIVKENAVCICKLFFFADSVHVNLKML